MMGVHRRQTLTPQQLPPVRMCSKRRCGSMLIPQQNSLSSAFHHSFRMALSSLRNLETVLLFIVLLSWHTSRHVDENRAIASGSQGCCILLFPTVQLH